MATTMIWSISNMKLFCIINIFLLGKRNINIKFYLLLRCHHKYSALAICCKKNTTWILLVSMTILKSRKYTSHHSFWCPRWSQEYMPKSFRGESEHFLVFPSTTPPLSKKKRRGFVGKKWHLTTFPLSSKKIQKKIGKIGNKIVQNREE